MITKFVGMREFRDNLAMFTKKSKKGVRYIVLRKNVPVLEVRPIDEKELAQIQLRKDIEEAEQSVREGRVYSQEEVAAYLGL